ncbi:MAG: FAD-dependent oxidoreductase [Clostridia bacterium]|nr:FAD-dependent oxidoreductase [Clostridia bacterium]
MNNNLLKKTLNCDFCIIGGGLSGTFAAISAARRGAKVVLIQDRPMLGGNASSEVRMWVRGAKGVYNRESGLIVEMEERNIYHNPTLNHSLFDANLYAMAEENENITLLLNTTCLDAEIKENKIVSVTGWQTTTYTFYTVTATIFADCSGDSILAPLTGAHFRHGRESKNEYGESLAQEVADEKTMGMSIILAARETDAPVPFTPPSFANVYPTDECFSAGEAKAHAQIRDHRIATSGANLWWVELGGEMDSIHDADKVRRELLACIYGVWDHIKNYGDHGMENWELEWVGFLPGKRESRRYIGDYVLTEHDVLSGGNFEDEIAYGGWPMDDHNPYGMRKNEENITPSIMIPVTKPYGIPLRCLYSKNVENLAFAGRNISVSHVALSSTRVMGTCALLGQAMGTAVSVALKYGIRMREVATNHYKEVQQILLENGVFLPHIKREVNLLSLSAKLNIPDEEKAILFNGVERPRSENECNGIVLNVGENLTFSYKAPQKIDTLRLRFDPDYERLSISDNFKMRIFAMKLHTGKDFKNVRVAKTIVKSFTVYADGKEVYSTDNNFHSLVFVPLNVIAKEIKIVFNETHGADKVKLFAVDFI